MEKKYEFTFETKTFKDSTLHRIKAVRDFGDVKAGDLGGWIEKEDNLSHDGECWVYDEAEIYANAKVLDNARICDESVVDDFAIVKDKAQLHGHSCVYGNAIVSDYARLSDYASVYDHAKIGGFARMYDYTDAGGNCIIGENVYLYDNIGVKGNVKMLGNFEITGTVRFDGDAKIFSRNDFMMFTNCWSSGRDFVWTRSNNMWKVGCFYGTGDELIKKAYMDSRESGHNYECVVNMVKNLIKI